MDYAGIKVDPHYENELESQFVLPGDDLFYTFAAHGRRSFVCPVKVTFTMLCLARLGSLSWAILNKEGRIFHSRSSDMDGVVQPAQELLPFEFSFYRIVNFSFLLICPLGIFLIWLMMMFFELLRKLFDQHLLSLLIGLTSAGVRFGAIVDLHLLTTRSERFGLSADFLGTTGFDAEIASKIAGTGLKSSGLKSLTKTNHNDDVEMAMAA